MTFDEVIKALDLIPFEEYRTCPKRLEWIAEMQKRSTENIQFRATGATTRMICRALTYLSNLPEGEKVYIKAHRPAYTRMLCSQARGYAERLGLDPLRIKPHNGPVSGLGLGPQPALFVDHY